ncbi:hypothetical protein [Pseudomonas viridiflava]|uniref:hypothetical protein n=1 Tax=Pseudomonas viridiflava TaxID=33069 RepID=UPI0013D9CF8A|nr:hypothetical protein [Pseudomonas viridiflava]
MPERIFIYCDESGAKGYADQQETFPGETGVFAGILIPEQLHTDLAQKFNAIALKFKPALGKLHIADLPKEQKGALRKALFDEIQAANLPCFWYAIHVAGLNEFYSNQLQASRDHRAAMIARRTSPARVKTGSVREELPSMHVELFGGFYAHIAAFLLERDRKNVELVICTDQLDAPLVKQFQQIAVELLDTNPKVTIVTGYDTLKKKLVYRKISSTTEYPAEMQIPEIISSLNIQPVPEDNGLILAADVLANSLNYLFKKRTEAELYTSLNNREAVVRHPLFTHLDAFQQWGSGDIIGDGLYRHPKAPNS